MKITFIGWVRYHRRFELMADSLDASLHFVFAEKNGKPVRQPARYISQALQTWRILSQEKPERIFVQNPPIFCAMLVDWYVRRHGGKYIIDSHTGAFVEVWRWSVGLHRRLSQRALLTIVHNRCQGSILQDWGCRYLVIGYTPGEYPTGEPYPLEKSPRSGNIGVISTGGLDEPLEVIFLAASRLPQIHFYVTGKPDQLPSHLLDQHPANIHLTGYLTNSQYIGLLRGVDAVMDLTTRQNTLLMGGFEAVAVGTPLIVSDTPLLRDYFSSGTIYIPNTVEGVCAGLEQLYAHQDIYRQDILHLSQSLQVEWDQNLKTLQTILQEE